MTGLEPAKRRASESGSTDRDRFIDLIRAASLLVVVVWHWAFQIIAVTDDGISVNNPIGFNYGLWPLTWVLQVMPLFFFVGGYAHLQVWRKVKQRGGGWGDFVMSRLGRLVPPALVLIGIWVAIGLLLYAVTKSSLAFDGVVLVLSPLWFLAVYAVLILVAPMMAWLHDRFDVVVLVFLAGLAALVDVFRFAHAWDTVGLVNLVVVWAFCHQLGFFYRRLADGPRQISLAMLWGGLFALAALTETGLYPRSMVGVPGDTFSNMGPPTLCIGALCALQAGLALLARPWVLARLDRPRWSRFTNLAGEFALPVYLFHTTGFVIAALFFHLIGYHPPETPTLAWWLQRPLWIAVPLTCTIPIILAFSRRAARRVAPSPA
jgi:peptidoglycan/LPS O-acetylase OafA/YrhL